jgi:hypothetical protein
MECVYSVFTNEEIRKIIRDLLGTVTLQSFPRIPVYYVTNISTDEMNTKHRIFEISSPTTVSNKKSDPDLFFT